MLIFYRLHQRTATRGHVGRTQVRTLLVSRLTLFNCRRGNEVATMKIHHWNDAVNDALIDMSRVEDKRTEEERRILKKLKIVYIPGKARHLVLVMIPTDIYLGISKLVELRSIYVSSTYDYVFAAGRGSDEHVIGNQCVAFVCQEAGITNSQITATKMRHRISTMYAAMDVPARERQTFYDVM